jgi:thymidylate kinase
MHPGTVFVSIAGGEAAGKKTALEGLKTRLLALQGSLKIATLHMTDFLRELSEEEIADIEAGRSSLEKLGRILPAHN